MPICCPDQFDIEILRLISTDATKLIRRKRWKLHQSERDALDRMCKLAAGLCLPFYHMVQGDRQTPEDTIRFMGGAFDLEHEVESFAAAGHPLDAAYVGRISETTNSFASGILDHMPPWTQAQSINLNSK